MLATSPFVVPNASAKPALSADEGWLASSGWFGFDFTLKRGAAGRLSRRLRYWLVWLWSNQGARLATLLAILLAGIAGYRLYYYYRRVLPVRQQTLRQQLHLDTADEQLAAKKSTADAAVREEVLKSVLELIATATQPFYQDGLFVPETPDRPAPVPFKATTGRGLSGAGSVALDCAAAAARPSGRPACPEGAAASARYPVSEKLLIGMVRCTENSCRL